MEWAPAECTLPTEERPLRTAEFDELFASALRGLERVGPTHLRLILEGGEQAEQTARDLATRETGCCSFFSFTCTPGGEGLALDIEVPAVHVKVLDGLAVRAIEAAPRIAS
ncbi:hypothetical protein Aros01_01614 [Streptosporangium roseum]|uniref:Arsenate reductase n=1 Tax=Streptosporangium roseum (strain ATCC 12428 / DSM 43021 / JCM 3005 / KCTC 9067 / NCIMB 10171 / NRRL 2505 / NI 9100) TaxID=479432 RepID=D2B623_STRRD|nr:hypothetical protein Sros_0713 [Streptosporangium roseum DSM 43021]